MCWILCPSCPGVFHVLQRHVPWKRWALALVTVGLLLGLHISHDQLCPSWSVFIHSRRNIPVVELFEWGWGIIALHIKARGYTKSHITMSMSLSTPCHSKTADYINGVVSMKSRRWWCPLVGGVKLHHCFVPVGMYCRGKGDISGGWIWDESGTWGVTDV